MKPLLPQPGSTIDPRNAVGRGRTSVRARAELLAGNNLGVNDPRRMGKTVWLDKFCSSPGGPLLAIKIDYEGVRTSEEFLLRTVAALRTHQSLPRRSRELLAAMFEGIEVAAGPVTVRKGVSTRTPTGLITETVRAVDAHLESDQILVIAMDEVPVAIDNVGRNEGSAAANQLLQTLRNLRREGRQIRWIVCGSIGFHHVLRRCGATEGAINDLVNLPLGPLENGEARELATRLFLGIGRSHDEAAVDAMVEESGGIPFLIHALAHLLHDAGTGPLFAQDVAEAFTAFMDDRDESRAATHLVTRLQPYYGDRVQMAEAILDRVAAGPSIASADVRSELPCSDADFDRILDDLIDDHYLAEQGGVVRWRYDVLRRIWVHRRRR